MRSRITTAAIALALVGAFLAPASAAQAASATVSGVVEITGKPVGGIPVGWFMPGTGASRTVTTARDGSYSLTLPSAGQEYVLFGNLDMKKAKQSRGNKSYVGVFYGAGDTRDYAYQTIDPYTATAGADEVDIELAAPGSISGYDQHLKDQWVELQTLGGTVVDSSMSSWGIVEFANLVPGQYRVTTNIARYGENYEFAMPETILTVTSGKKTRFTPGAFTGGVISGIATGTNGKPAAGVRVRATPTYKGIDPEFGQESKTDSRGRYALRHLHGPSYTVTFSTPGDSSDQKDGDRGYLPESQEITGVTETSTIVHNVKLATGGRVRGSFPSTSVDSENTLTLLDSKGKVLNGDYYHAVDGHFTVGSLKSGSYTAYFTNHVGSKYAKRTFAVKAGRTTDLGTITRTKRGVSLSGRVPNFNRKPDAYYTGVLATKAGGPRYYTSVDKNGKYSLKGLVPGTYAVLVYSGGRDNKVYSLKVTKNTATTLSAGPKWGSVKATFTVGGLPVPKGTLSIGEPFDHKAGTISDGAWKVTGRSGTYRTVHDFDTISVFQANSPNWLTLPDRALPITITGGRTRNRGTIALTAH